MARDKPIYATVSTIQLLVTSLTNNTTRYRRFESDALSVLFLQTIYRFYEFSCHRAMRRGHISIACPGFASKLAGDVCLRRQTFNQLHAALRMVCWRSVSSRPRQPSGEG
jgi:hypothetical protein